LWVPRRWLALPAAFVLLIRARSIPTQHSPTKLLPAFYPYTTQPDEVTPGVPTYYATAAPLAGYGAGVLVRSNEGRPTKVEGNPDHPSSLGGAGIFALASTFDLYDADRSRGATHRGLATSHEAAVEALRKQLYDDSGAPKEAVKLRIVTETITSPTLGTQLAKVLKAFPNAIWIPYDAASRENIRAGTIKAFGKPLNVVYDFTKADVILSLDGDFLTSGPGSTRYSREFSDRRKIRQDGKDAKEIAEGSKKEGVHADQLNRLYAVECMPTPTGSVADHRLPLASSQVESFARALADELGVAGAPRWGTLTDSAKAWLKPLAEDLKRAKGKSIVIAGEHQPASLHALVHAINAQLENLGKTVSLSAPLEFRPQDEKRVSDLKTLATEMAKKDQVDVLLVLGTNPAYTAPVDIPFAAGVKNARFSLHMGTHQDETAVLCEWHTPESHFLEAWGDIRGHDGTISIQQPLIAPLFEGKSILEFLAVAFATSGASEPNEGLDIVKKFWREQFAVEQRKGEFEIFWQEVVRAGLIAGTALKHETIALAKTWADNSGNPPAVSEFEINFRTDPALFDGRFANNGWLQELPKPVSKITWDNAAFMSKATAEKLKLPDAVARWTAGEHGRMEVTILELELNGKKVKAPAWVLPAHADGAITVHLGYGRTRAGHFSTTPDEPNADNKPVRGFNAYELRTSDALWTAQGLKVSLTNKTYFLGCTQAYQTMTQRDPLTGHELDRKPVRWGTYEKIKPEVPSYKDIPQFAKIPPMAALETHEINENVPEPKHESHANGNANANGGEGEHHDSKHALTMYYDDEKFKRFTPGLKPAQQRRWAMAVDLSGCTGCSACVIACVGENNTPVVGKYQVTRGREMHWIRVDRYYVKPEGPAGEVVTLFQPVMCVQCENAPCEVVCPVGATVHSADGLNDMTYNRCVGTRYCSNNCPYKVRRFNFLTFQDWETNTLKLGRNPDVSVRSRGVMEKCTFCVQRIRGAEIVAEREGRAIKDGEIVTACQAACPSGVIIFGDLNDAHSQVAKWKNEPRNYGLLAELNTRPRLTHLAVVKNPNPAMPRGA
jgi:molybdopterin-containing oxidoreductase family iron-sulfur binding subunit